mmetsp:Transcript_39510/g.99602  ORF Transcript_39510/g.99602 Transcript_39510/m.99602 type:complete len:174 (+) Transcript_39510:75-596(+)|eukprot:CAMPEP_0177650772 /NCGR_PEP_ID=MMETSP0447-20121125/12136_1 /TAXON_ID=0 /ORGANISM="Stygamoeba regulata, Strain BSH-02190019" /LENGTH=173 /DNA_ID=CAMNT_0019153695 /DNA_START=55 /DNA_END=576 /DNA_ORIENTATION=+
MANPAPTPAGAPSTKDKIFSFAGEHKVALGIVGGIAALGAVAGGAYVGHEMYEKSKQSGSSTRLHIKLIDGKDLAAKDDNGKSDPFVVIKCGHATVKSNVIKANLNPVWNQTFDLGFTPEEKEVHFALFDEDFFGDDDLGEVTVPLAEIPTAPQTFTLKLPEGHIRVEMHRVL